MSNAVSALNSERHEGFVTVSEAGLVGMITIRSDQASKPLVKALKDLGLSLPPKRGITEAGGLVLAWMSPDELLLICPHDQAPAHTGALEAALAKTHALVVNVSDARALMHVRGARADEVMMKLSPADIQQLPAGEMRRTRFAQVPAAFWRSGREEISVICFRSVAAYVMGLLEVSARPGSELF
ncbi:sarcosine oxidase subunit gamma [Thioclava dalianensis]|uniref:Sarcosine oxidase subunit gamma n=1 Tax=Thioclava dalianensis TaxID=1185766 RepID=A0A074TLN5_9RHOB|nr:sarcosine oxidase subunit gamma family protein [Thioclava dalianensis]KEP71085.1 sarcosine oxidase subunit gamma [Thioclava dalianensis]SFN25139.1 sarcosine oxidase subunit gamma [Thioclava dalianensis]